MKRRKIRAGLFGRDNLIALATVAGGCHTAHGKGVCPGSFGKEENRESAGKLISVSIQKQRWINTLIF